MDGYYKIIGVRRVEKKALLNINKKEEILSAATKLFYEHGYDFTKTRELAKAVNISNAGLYHHFSEKEMILFNIIDSAVNNFYEKVSKVIIPGEDPQNNIERFIRNALRIAIKDRMALALMIKEEHRLNKDQLEIINQKKRLIFDLVKIELAKIKYEGEENPSDISFASLSLMALIFWPFLWYKPGGTMDVEKLGYKITNLFFNGFRDLN